MTLRELVSDVVTRQQMPPYHRVLLLESLSMAKIGSYELTVLVAEDDEPASVDAVEVVTDEKQVVLSIL